MDMLGSMMLSSPTFEDDSGYFPEQNINTVFFSLNEGLKMVRKKLGEDRYSALLSLSDQMRIHFEADAEDKSGDTLAGRELILEMEDILKRQNVANDR